jgi:hypothetical protein
MPRRVSHPKGGTEANPDFPEELLPEVPAPTPRSPVIALGGGDPLREALHRIAAGRLCGCRGMHDNTEYDCPKHIARVVLGLKP